MSEPINALLGPCRCQGCGQEVLYVRHGRAEGWLHANGLLRCWGSFMPAKTPAKTYNREWMRRKRARAA